MIMLKIYQRNRKNKCLEDVYFDKESSTEFAIKLLQYQFDNDSELIHLFLTAIDNVVNKVIPTFNSVFIMSPPFADKNFIFYAIESFLFNYSIFGTVNKTNNFSWADGAGKRLVWNEQKL